MKLLDNIITNLEGESIYGLTTELKGLFLYKKFIKENKNILCVTSSLYEANRLFQVVTNYTDKVCFFPMDDFVTSEALAISPEFKLTRLDTLNKLLDDKNIVITNLMGFLRYLPNYNDYKKSFCKIKLNDEVNIDNLVNNLYKIGYKRESIVTMTGEIAVRGFIIDIFPINMDNPIRIEFWGDTVDRISEFDIDTQMSKGKLEEIIISPTTEFICDKDVDINLKQRDLVKYTDVSSIIDYMDKPIIFFNDREQVNKSYELLVEEMNNYKETNNMNLNTKFMFDLESNYDNEINFVSFDNESKGNINKYQTFELENFIGSISQISDRLDRYVKDKKYK